MTDRDIANIKRLLKPGDVVYLPDHDEESAFVWPFRVEQVDNRGVTIFGGTLLAYDSYREVWFLTQIMAQEAAERLEPA